MKRKSRKKSAPQTKRATQPEASNRKALAKKSLGTRASAKELAKPETVDNYIAGCAPKVRVILQSIRQLIRKVAPEAEESISYRIPTFRLNGPLVYFAAFKNHIGFYPPVRGDDALAKAVASYAGPKGNLRFPLSEPIPYKLIERIVKVRVRQNAGRNNSRPSSESM